MRSTAENIADKNIKNDSSLGKSPDPSKTGLNQKFLLNYDYGSKKGMYASNVQRSTTGSANNGRPKT